jgi:hypothetical protein
VHAVHVVVTLHVIGVKNGVKILIILAIELMMSPGYITTKCNKIE